MVPRSGPPTQRPTVRQTYLRSEELRIQVYNKTFVDGATVDIEDMPIEVADQLLDALSYNMQQLLVTGGELFDFREQLSVAIRKS